METVETGVGAEMHAFARELFPICRSLTGDGVRETLRRIQTHLPGLALHETPTGTKAFDWTVPEEWRIRSARLIGPDGETVVDFAENNLHVVGYSEPVDRTLDLDELQAHLYSLPEQPDAIPYVTSYYRRAWGFCLSDRQRQALRPGAYRAVIDSELFKGALTYGELVIPGASEQEIFLSTYVCHPSMANNELSGPMVATWLAKWIASAPRRYSYRIVFIPETIGSILYLSRWLEHLKRRVVAGFNLTCIGDERAYSYLPSRHGDTLADRAARHALGHLAPDHVRYSYLDRGSDERQYCAPGVDLPVCSVMRSKYHAYPEYHTSLDDLELVTPAGLEGGYTAVKRCLETLELNEVYRATVLCEPQLGKRGLYPSTSMRGSAKSVSRMMNLLAYADGEQDLLGVAERIGAPVWELADTVETLEQNGLLARLSGESEAGTATSGAKEDGAMKFKTEDEAYLSRRKAYSAETGPRELWSVIDHWPLYCGVGNLARFMAVSDILRGVLDIPGHLAEFGSWRGGNLMFLAKLLKIYDPHGSKVVHCFDSFEGLTEFAPQDGGADADRGRYRGSLEELQAMMGLYGLTDDVVINKGVIENVLPELLASDPALSFSFVYCDTDLYESTKTILNGLHDRLSIGGVFVLDEWNHPRYPGETAAVREFMAAHEGAYAMEHVAHARQPSLVLRRRA